MPSYVEMLRERIQKFGKTSSAPAIMDRFVGVKNVFTDKGFMGVMQSSVKGEKPLLQKVAPDMPFAKPGGGLLGGKTSEAFFRRIPGYGSSPAADLTRRGGTEFGSIQN